jgi:succinylglutamate desuccinylase
MTELALTILNALPDGFLDCSATELYRLLPGPTLIHLPGHRPEPVFVSALLHGNETTGFLALQGLLQKYTQHPLPRALSIFIGNVEAARHGRRRLEDQVDYNRVWSHTGFRHDSVESRIMDQVVEEMRRRNVFVSIDIHNNTGLNPHYACINKLNNAFYQLAILFSRTVIYFTTPKGVQSQAFAEVCPAVTVECGKVGHEQGTVHAMQFIEASLDLAALPDRPMLKQDIDLFHTVATVYIPDTYRYSFEESDVDIRLSPALEKMNFSELDAGRIFARVQDGIEQPFSVIDEQGEQVFDRYFRISGNELQNRCPLMPSMLTTDVDIIHKDCLCYIMERLHLEQ